MLNNVRRWSWCALLLLAASASAYSAPKTVLVLGDSLSAEYGIGRGSGWVALLAQRLKEQKVDAVIVNASISGETTSGGRARLPKLLEQYHPALVAIELGANDGLRGLPLSNAEDNLRDMVAKARASHAQVLLIGMRLPPNYGGYADQFSAVFGNIAKQSKVALVPFMLDGIAEKPELFQGDRLHPLAAAHPAILANIWPQFSALMKIR
jgi:acyl-CoA thioesterase-1